MLLWRFYFHSDEISILSLFTGTVLSITLQISFFSLAFLFRSLYMLGIADFLNLSVKALVTTSSSSCQGLRVRVWGWGSRSPYRPSALTLDLESGSPSRGSVRTQRTTGRLVNISRIVNISSLHFCFPSFHDHTVQSRTVSPTLYFGSASLSALPYLGRKSFYNK